MKYNQSEEVFVIQSLIVRMSIVVFSILIANPAGAQSTKSCLPFDPSYSPAQKIAMGNICYELAAQERQKKTAASKALAEKYDNYSQKWANLGKLEQTKNEIKAHAKKAQDDRQAIIDRQQSDYQAKLKKQRDDYRETIREYCRQNPTAPTCDGGSGDSSVTGQQ